MSEFYYARAVKLPPNDFVLFLFNYATGLGLNNFEATVSKPLGLDEAGRCIVEIVGKGELGPNGDGGYFNKARFAYRRTPLSALGIPEDGSFFDIIGGRPSFKAIVSEVRRRTQFNCDVDDFVQTEYRTDLSENYVLRAHPDSLRFEGQVSLGRPRRANFDQFIPEDALEYSLADMDGIFDLKIDRMVSNFDFTNYQSMVSKLVVGYVVKTSDVQLFNAMLLQASFNGMQLVNQVASDSFLNVNGMTVIYHGPLRQDADDKHPFESRDRVIELVPNTTYAPKAFGSLKIYYCSTAPAAPTLASEHVYALNMHGTQASGTAYAEFWRSVVVGVVLDDNGPSMVVKDAFEAAFGLTYDLLLKRSLRVTYNGPARPNDFVPAGLTTCNVVEMMPVDSLLDYVYGPAKVYYQ